MSRFKVIVLAVFCFAILTTCKKQNDRPQWDVGVLGPLITGSMGITNLINDTLLKVNPDSTLTLVYDKSLYSLNIDSLVQIPDTTVVTGFSIPFSFSLPPATHFPVAPSQTNLMVNNVQLRYAIVKSGVAHLEAINKLHTRFYFIYSIPKATLNGIPFVVNAFVDSADMNGLKTLTKDFDLSGYDIDLTGLNGNQVNSIEYNVVAYTDSFGPPAPAIANDSFLVIKNSFESVIPYYVKGYLGQTTLNIGPDSTALDLFKTIKSGILDLESATMKLTIENDIGMDAILKVLDIHSYNSNITNSVALIAPALINKSPNINRAGSGGTSTNPSYIPSFYTIQIDNTNSDFKSLLNNLPDYLAYTLTLQTNPLGNVSGDNDFAFADHLVNANIDLEVPMNFSSSNLLMSDTADFSLSGDSTLNNLGAGSFIFNVDNGFPFSVNITLVTIDSLNHFLDMLVSNGVAAAPPLDANFKVTGKKRSQFVIPVDDARIALLRHAKRMIVSASFTSAAGISQHVKFYSDYSLDFKLIADLTYHIR